MAACADYAPLYAVVSGALYPITAGGRGGGTPVNVFYQPLVPPSDLSLCPYVVVSGGEYQTLVTSMSFDGEAFEMAFGGALVVFAVGLTIGLIISVVRKAQRI